MNLMDLVIFEDEAFDTMMPYSYPSLNIPSVFYEYLTLMFGYGLGDANVSYFLGLAKHLKIRGGGTGKVVFLNWAENNSKHHQVIDRDNFLVVETKDILTTLQFLTARLDNEEEIKERDRLDALYGSTWSTEIPIRTVNLFSKNAEREFFLFWSSIDKLSR